MRKTNKFSQAIFILVAICLVVSGCQKRPPDESPNVLILLMDTLRADHLGYQRYELNTSPNLDAFARENSFLEPFYTVAPWTSPAVASLFTGLYPSSHGVLGHPDLLDGETRVEFRMLPESANTLAEFFRSQGYRTAAVSSNPWVLKEFGFDQGFEQFVVLPNKAPAEAVNAEAFKYLDSISKTKRPFFLYVHYMDCHGMYVPPKPYNEMFLPEKPQDEQLVLPKNLVPKYLDLVPDGTMTLEYLVSQYDGAIRYFDDQFAKILESLKSRGIYDNTVIVFVSDHGEEFMEHGALDHGWTLYQEQLSVPFIMKPAGNEKIQWNLHGRVPEIIDIYPTVVAAAGLVCAESNLAGRNLLVEGEPEHAFAEADKKNSMASLTGEGFKYIRQTKAKKAQLFNLEQDPSEQNDLRNGSLDAKWDESVFQRVSESKERSLKPEIATVREAELERLRSMGYVN